MMFVNKKKQWLRWIAKDQTSVLLSGQKSQQLFLVVMVFKFKLALEITAKQT